MKIVSVDKVIHRGIGRSKALVGQRHQKFRQYLNTDETGIPDEATRKTNL